MNAKKRILTGAAIVFGAACLNVNALRAQNDTIPGEWNSNRQHVKQTDSAFSNLLPSTKKVDSLFGNVERPTVRSTYETAIALLDSLTPASTADEIMGVRKEFEKLSKISGAIPEGNETAVAGIITNLKDLEAGTRAYETAQQNLAALDSNSTAAEVAAVRKEFEQLKKNGWVPAGMAAAVNGVITDLNALEGEKLLAEEKNNPGTVDNAVALETLEAKKATLLEACNELGALQGRTGIAIYNNIIEEINPDSLSVRIDNYIASVNGLINSVNSENEMNAYDYAEACRKCKAISDSSTVKEIAAARQELEALKNDGRLPKGKEAEANAILANLDVLEEKASAVAGAFDALDALPSTATTTEIEKVYQQFKNLVEKGWVPDGMKTTVDGIVDGLGNIIK